MSLIATAVGKTVVLYTGFDMSSKTDLEAYFLDSDGTLSLTVADARLSLIGSGITDSVLGTLTANYGAQFDTLSTDFTSAGTYTGYIRYTDASNVLYSRSATLTVIAVGS